MKKARVGIVGGAGYTGGELVRLLLNHEQVELAFVQSKSQSGRRVAKTHRDLLGVTELVFSDDKRVYEDSTLDAIFLAQGHGEAKHFLEAQRLSPSLRVIDLSQDFRLKKDECFLDRRFVYGLPEMNREEIRLARNIANPGCFATAIQLALLPLALKAKESGFTLPRAIVTGITGSTGAGQKLAETAHFSFRANNIQAYKTLVHQHVAEIEANLNAKVSFTPWRGDFTRGIFVSATLHQTLFPFPASGEETKSLYKKYYQGHPFVSVCDEAIDLKSVVNTNRALIEVNQVDDELVIHAAIDNLIKGASGQAIQNLNLMLGFPETTGLNLKGVAF